MKKVWIGSAVMMFALFCNGLMAWNVKLQWDQNDPAENITEYGVYKSTASGTGFNKIATVAANDAAGDPVAQPEYNDENIAAGLGPFFYVITAVNDNGESDFSNEVRADEPLVPTAPVGLTIEVSLGP